MPLGEALKGSLKVSLIGCGFIGSTLAQAIDDGNVGEAKLVTIYDAIGSAAEKLAGVLRKKPHIAKDLREILGDESSLVIEASTQEAAKTCLPLLLKASKDVLTMSVGAFSDASFREEIKALASEKGRRVFIPSGAIAGLDGVKGGAVVQLSEVTLTTTKHPKALAGAPYVTEKKIDLSAVKKPTEIYSGRAEEACRYFPANVNVAAALSLAGIGFQKTKVRIIADPSSSVNIHEIEVKGDFGSMKVRMENAPSPTNPKTSYMAALSAIRKLQELSSPISVGT